MIDPGSSDKRDRFRRLVLVSVQRAPPTRRPLFVLAGLAAVAVILYHLFP